MGEIGLAQDEVQLQRDFDELQRQTSGGCLGQRGQQKQSQVGKGARVQ